MADTSPASSLPKPYYRIGEVAELVGVEPHVLRYWEREFRTIRPTKSAKGQRVYSRRDVENLMKVRELLYEDGFTIAGAKKKLSQPSSSLGQRENEPAPESSEQALPEPASDPGEPAEAMRRSLYELRAEIVAFLAELGEGEP